MIIPTIILAGVVFYAIVGLAVHALSVWLTPERYAQQYCETTERRAFDVFLWPIALVLALSRNLTTVVLRSKADNLRIRAELEKELAAARREIDEFIRKGVAS